MFDMNQLKYFPVSWRLEKNKALERIKMSRVCYDIMNDSMAEWKTNRSSESGDC